MLIQVLVILIRPLTSYWVLESFPLAVQIFLPNAFNGFSVWPVWTGGMFVTTQFTHGIIILIRYYCELYHFKVLCFNTPQVIVLL